MKTKIMKKDNQVIDFILSFHWYDQWVIGAKRVEYREVKKWRKKLEKKLAECEANKQPLMMRLRRGYTNIYQLWQIDGITIMDGIMTDLHCDGKVYALHGHQLIMTNSTCPKCEHYNSRKGCAMGLETNPNYELTTLCPSWQKSWTDFGRTP